MHYLVKKQSKYSSIKNGLMVALLACGIHVVKGMIKSNSHLYFCQDFSSEGLNEENSLQKYKKLLLLTIHPTT